MTVTLLSATARRVGENEQEDTAACCREACAAERLSRRGLYLSLYSYEPNVTIGSPSLKQVGDVEAFRKNMHYCLLPSRCTLNSTR